MTERTNNSKKKGTNIHTHMCAYISQTHNLNDYLKKSTTDKYYLLYLCLIFTIHGPYSENYKSIFTPFS